MLLIAKLSFLYLMTKLVLRAFGGLCLCQIPMIIESANTHSSSTPLLCRFLHVYIFVFFVRVYLTNNKALFIGFPRLVVLPNSMEEIEHKENNRRTVD